MSETLDILVRTVDELEQRERTLVEEIERIEKDARQELRDVQKAIRQLRKQLNGAAPAVDEALPTEVTNETKDAVMAALEADNIRVAGIATAAHLHPEAVRGALSELRDTGDVETYGKGLWRITE